MVATNQMYYACNAQERFWCCPFVKRSFTRVFAVAAVALTVAGRAWSDPPSDGTIGSEPVTIVGYALGQAFTMPRCTKDKHGFTDFAAREACWTIASATPGPTPRHPMGD